MRRVSLLIALACVCCGGDEYDTGRWARGEATIDGRDYGVRRIAMDLEFGEDGHYNISGDPVENADQDCIPGLSGGISLYGPIPASATEPEQLEGTRLPVEFSGDGDDANLCFLGLDGLLGARRATIEIVSVEGDRVRFNMSGDFDWYDGEGGMDSSRREVTVTGAAQIVNIW